MNQGGGGGGGGGVKMFKRLIRNSNTNMNDPYNEYHRPAGAVLRLT